jgi:hypothetical protein
LLICIERFGEDVVSGQDHDDGKLLVDQSQHTVLQLTRHDSFAVQVGDFLDLESAFQSSRELMATTKEQHRLLALEEFLAHLFDGLAEFEDFFELVADFSKTFDDFFASLGLGGPVFAQRQSKHDHGHELRGVRLGRSDTDFRTSIDVYTAVGQERDGRANNVDNTNGQCTTLQAVAQRHERIGSLARLRHEDTSIVTEDGGLSVEEVGGQLHGDGDVGKLLEGTTDCHARVVARSAGNEYQSSAASDGAHVLPQTTKGDCFVGNVETTTHGVDDRLGLLEDFLLHEVVELALHDLLELKLDGLNGSDIGGAIILGESVDVELTIMDVSNIVIFEIENLLGVFDERRSVRGEEEFSRLRHAIVRQEGPRLGAVEEGLVRGSKQVVGGQHAVDLLLDSNIVIGSLSRESSAFFRVFDIDKVDLHLSCSLDANHEGRTLPGSNDFVGVSDRLHKETESTLELFDDSLAESGEVDVWVGVVEVFGEFGNAFSVGLSLKLETLALQKSLELLVVGDDTIVNDDKLGLGIRSNISSASLVTSQRGQG